MGWKRYEGRALADSALTGEARDTELEGFIRLDNPQLCDVRLESATATDDQELARRWYRVTYLADDGEGANLGRLGDSTPAKRLPASRQRRSDSGKAPTDD